MRPVSIVILTHNGLDFTKACIESVRATAEEYELVVVDNASSDGTVEWLKGQDVFARFNLKNEGFAVGVNQGVRCCHHGTICLLNNDTVCRPGWLDAMRDALKKPVGIVGAKLLFPDDRIQHAGVYFRDHTPYHRWIGLPERIEEANVSQGVPCVTAACLLATKTVWDRVGGMDEGYIQANFEDVDFNLKAREAGFRVWYEAKAVLTHHSAATIMACPPDESPGRYYEQNLARLREKWGDKLT